MLEKGPAIYSPTLGENPERHEMSPTLGGEKGAYLEKLNQLKEALDKMDLNKEISRSSEKDSLFGDSTSSITELLKELNRVKEGDDIEKVINSIKKNDLGTSAYVAAHFEGMTELGPESPILPIIDKTYWIISDKKFRKFLE